MKQFAQSRTGFRGGEPRAATLTFTQLLTSDVLNSLSNVGVIKETPVINGVQSSGAVS